MSLEAGHDDLTPPPSELPAYVHPTLPPPIPAVGKWGRWTGPSLLVGCLALVAADAEVGPSVFGHVRAAARDAAARALPDEVAAERPPLGIHMERILQAFPLRPASKSCPHGTGEMPLVLYSSITAPPAVELGRTEARWIRSVAPSPRSFLSTAARQVALLRTTELEEPTTAHPGRYEGTLVVFDAATNAPLCEIVIHATGGNADFGAAVQRAVAQAAARLDVTIDI